MIGYFGLTTAKTTAEPVCWTATDIIAGGAGRLLTRSGSGVSDTVSVGTRSFAKA